MILKSITLLKNIKFSTKSWQIIKFQTHRSSAHSNKVNLDKRTLNQIIQWLKNKQKISLLKNQKNYPNLKMLSRNLPLQHELDTFQIIQQRSIKTISFYNPTSNNHSIHISLLSVMVMVRMEKKSQLTSKSDFHNYLKRIFKRLKMTISFL